MKFISSDGKVIASIEGNNLRIFDILNGKDIVISFDSASELVDWIDELNLIWNYRDVPNLVKDGFKNV